MDIDGMETGERPPFLLAPGEPPNVMTYRFFRSVPRNGILTRKADGTLWIAHKGAFPAPICTLDEFRARVEDLFDFQRVVAVADGAQRTISCHLSRDDALSLYYSPAAQELPELKATVLEPTVFQPGPGQPLMLSRPGFDESTGVFYYIPPGEEPIAPLEGVSHLVECFSAVPFEREEYRNNLFAWLLGAIFFDEFMDPPLLVISGNQRGIGKSKTLESAGMILTGSFPSPVNPAGEEFEKQLSARFREGSRFISLDNIVSGTGRPYRNDKLSRLITQSWSKKVRILGHSRSVEQKGVLFALTANDCRLETDLATRALPVKLYCERPRPMVPYVRAYALEHRRELYGELLGLALRDVPPMDAGLFPEFRFRKWLEFVYPRVKSAIGAMALDEVRELDDGIHDLYAWGIDQGDRFEFTSQDLIVRMQTEPEKLWGLTERFHSVTSTRSKRIMLTKFLKQCDGQSVNVNTTLVTLRMVREGDSNTPPTFSFDIKEVG